MEANREKSATVQTRLAAIATVLLVLAAACTGTSQRARSTVVDDLVASVKPVGGIASLVCAPGTEDLIVPLTTALPGGLYVHALVGPEVCPTVRETVLEANLSARVAVSSMEEDQPLPYASDLLNLLIVAESDGWGQPAAEMLRVVAPLGQGLIKVRPASGPGEIAEDLREAGATNIQPLAGDPAWLTFEKPWPKDMGEWGQHAHGPDNNPVTPDLRVGPPGRLQWTAGPRWSRNHEAAGSLPTMVSAGGRIFAIMDEGPIGITAENVPDKWALIARDAFNGRMLWRRSIGDWGWRSWRKDKFTRVVPPTMARGLVATDERIVVTDGFRGDVLVFDAATGEMVRRCAETKGTDELVLSDQVLFTVQQIGNDKQHIRAMSLTDGHVLWEREATCQPRTLCTSGSGVFWWDDGVVVAHDRTSGMRLWTGGKLAESTLRHRPGAKTRFYSLIVADGVVLAASSGYHGTLTALDAVSGKQLWQTRQRAGYYNWAPPELFVIDGTVWADGHFEEWLPSYRQGNEHLPYYRFPTMMRVAGRDLRTGKLLHEIDTGGMFKTGHHHRCYGLRATTRYIMAGRRGTEFVDLKGDDFSVNNWLRGSCQFGFIPANGLLYTTPHPCPCYLSAQLTGLNALASDRSDPPVAGPETLFRRGPAYDRTSGQPPEVATADDWPAYRHDARRSGATSHEVPADLHQVWSVPIGGRLTQPVVAGPTIVVAQVDTGTLNAYDRESAKRLWRFSTGGRIDSAPTVTKGYVLVGCRDGWLYCLRLRDGALVWQRRLAPQDLLIGDHGQLSSAWPGHGAVLATDGIVYAAAGRSSVYGGGIWVYGLDVQTGAVRCRTQLIHPPDKDPRGIPENNAGSMPGYLSDVLLREGDAIFMRHAKLDLALKTLSSGWSSAARVTTWHRPMRVYGTPDDVPHLVAGSGLLDATMFNRTAWVRGDATGKLIVWNDSVTCSLNTYRSPERNLLSPVFFPATDGVLIAGRRTLSGMSCPKELFLDPPSDACLWQIRVPVRVEAMVLAGHVLFLAGQPDRIDADDPLGSFEGRKGGQLIAIDSRHGKKLHALELASPPVFDGISAAHGRLWISTQSGELVCLAGPKTK